MSETLSKIPDGLRYYSGHEARLRRTVQKTAMTVFDGWSYDEIITPTLDYFSLFERVMGAEAHHAFRFTDTDGRLLALRPDVTSGIARLAATLFASRQRPLRLCYSAPVFHQQVQSSIDWRRESTQVGCELLGRAGLVADIEVLLIAVEILKKLALKDAFVITINEVEIFNGVADNLGLDRAARDQLRRLVDGRNVVDLEDFLKPLVSNEESRAFAQLIRLSGKFDTIEHARRVITNERSAAALDRLEGLWRAIESLGLEGNFEIDLGDVARLDYYTGLTFKIYATGAGGRVGSGGRYDNLTANFGAPEPAVGFVLDLDVLAGLLLADQRESTCKTPQESSQRIVNRDPVTLFSDAVERRRRGERVSIDLSEEVAWQN